MVVLLALILALQSQLALALERPNPPLWMDFREGRLSMQVREGSWESVLQELRHRTGIRLHLHLRLEGPLSVSFNDLPVERALRRLFGPEANFIFQYPAPHTADTASDQPTQVWVIGKTTEAQPIRPATAGARDVPAVATPTHAPEPESEWATVFEKNPQAAQDMALSAADSEERLAAIAYLSRQANPGAVRVLLEIVDDPDPHLRQSALDGLLPLLDTNPHIRQGLTHVLQAAQDPEVRQLVADVLGGTEQAPPEQDTSDTAGDDGEGQRVDAAPPD
jgi:HEAT repeat protein